MLQCVGEDLFQQKYVFINENLFIIEQAQSSRGQNEVS
jgi:hypothetical protein